MLTQILAEFERRKHLKASDLSRKLAVSRQAIHRYLQILLRQGKIRKQGTSRKTAFYVLNDPAALRQSVPERVDFHRRYEAKGLDEEGVYREIKAAPSLLDDLWDNVRTIFHYAFTEMLNNAIDHSGTDIIDVSVSSDPTSVSFIVCDRGIGIFENIRSKKNLGSEMEGLQEILKGKQTTLPERHSGEGIFFTSKVVDRFQIESHRKTVIIDNTLDDLFVDDIRFRRGTRVVAIIGKNTVRTLEAVFREYTGEDLKFDKSRVTVRLFEGEDEYISRSQAKRLLNGLEKFEEVTLDFQGVRTVGQGFADEVFRVFTLEHPETKITPTHCNENVDFMIKRALA